MKNKLELIASKELASYEQMYKIIDFLNKNLSDYDLVFGMTERDDKHIINIYKEK